MGWLLLLLLLLLWVVTAALTSLLGHARPWRALPPSLQRYQRLIVQLEQLREGLMVIGWLLMVLAVVTAGYFFGGHFGLLAALGLTLLIAILVLCSARLGALQQMLLVVVQSIQRRFGTHLSFIPKFIRLCGKASALFFADGPLWHDEKEMATFLEYHHRKYKQLSTGTQQQLISQLKIDEKRVGSLVVPLKEAMLVKGEEMIGPILLKELHDSVYSVFGVYEEKRTHLVGILEQGVALSHASRNVKVSTLLDEHILYLTADTTYREALSTFMETNTTLAAIVDENSRPIGVLYLRDILKRLFGG